MTHYPVVMWRPSEPVTAARFGRWRPVTSWPLPDQAINDDVIDLSWELVDGGSQRNFQNLAANPSFSRPDLALPLAVPTLFAPNTTIQFFPTYESISFAPPIAETDATKSRHLGGDAPGLPHREHVMRLLPNSGAPLGDTPADKAKAEVALKAMKRSLRGWLSFRNCMDDYVQWRPRRAHERFVVRVPSHSPKPQSLRPCATSVSTTRAHWLERSTRSYRKWGSMRTACPIRMLPSRSRRGGQARRDCYRWRLPERAANARRARARVVRSRHSHRGRCSPWLPVHQEPRGCRQRQRASPLYSRGRLHRLGLLDQDGLCARHRMDRLGQTRPSRTGHRTSFERGFVVAISTQLPRPRADASSRSLTCHCLTNHRRATAAGQVGDRLEASARARAVSGLDLSDLLEQGRELLDAANPAFGVAIDVLADPYLAEIVCHAERLARIEQGKPAGVGVCQDAGSRRRDATWNWPSPRRQTSSRCCVGAA